MAIFTVPITAVSVSAAQDLWSIKAGTTRPVILHSFNLGQRGLTTVDAMRLRIRRVPATMTQGSGGTAPTPVNISPGGSASGVTAHINDTTQATSSGTIVTEWEDILQALNGIIYMPPPEDRMVFDAGSGFVIDTPTVFAGGAATMSGAMVYEEVGL